MNIASTLDQPYQFCAVIYAGMLCGVLYTIFTCIRALFKSKAPKFACDIVFSLVCFTFLFIALYYITAFRLRIYHFTGIAAGFLLFVLYHVGFLFASLVSLRNPTIIPEIFRCLHWNHVDFCAGLEYDSHMFETYVRGLLI